MISLPLHIPKSSRYLFIPIIGLMALAVGRDLFYSFSHQSSFYLSESLLFNSFWALFLPIVLFSRMLAGRFPSVHYSIISVVLTMFHITLFSFTVYAVSGIFMYHTFSFSGVFAESLSDHWLTCLMVYGVFHYLEKDKPKTNPNSPSLSMIKVSHLNQNILLPISEVQYVKTERPYIALVTTDKTYLYNDTLHGFKAKIASGNFLQIHKSTIINPDYVRSYTSRKNGDHDVQMMNGDNVRASRNYSQEFKSIITHRIASI